MAGQDIKKLIAAGGVQNINTGGDYIYLKFADRPVNVVITGGRSGGSKVTMEAGDKYRPGSFQAFEVENTDPDNPAQVIFTVGEGDYNRQIVKGEISVIPGVRAADGTFIEDTRWELAAEVDITDLTPKTFSKNSQVEFVNTSANISHMALLLDANEMLTSDNNDNHKRWDLDTETSVSIGSNTVDLGSYETHAFKGVLDAAGNTWISGRRKSDNNAAALRIDRDLNVMEAVVAPVDEYSFTNTSASPEVCFDDEGTLYFVVPVDSIYKVNVYRLDGSSLTLLGTINKGSEFWVARHFHIEDGHLVWAQPGSASAHGAFTLPDLTQVSGAGFINFEYGGMTVPSQRIYWKCEAQTDFRAFSLITWTRTGQGTFETCAGGYAFDLETHQTEASITSEQVDRGVQVSGQVIRALLELWLGQFVADDYLDHVYKVEFDNANGRAPVTVSSGGTSFAGAKISDSFVCVFPQRVRITLDNNLTTKD